MQEGSKEPPTKPKGRPKKNSVPSFAEIQRRQGLLTDPQNDPSNFNNSDHEFTRLPSEGQDDDYDYDDEQEEDELRGAYDEECGNEADEDEIRSISVEESGEAQADDFETATSMDGGIVSHWCRDPVRPIRRSPSSENRFSPSSSNSSYTHSNAQSGSDFVESAVFDDNTRVRKFGAKKTGKSKTMHGFINPGNSSNNPLVQYFNSFQMNND